MRLLKPGCSAGSDRAFCAWSVLAMSSALMISCQDSGPGGDEGDAALRDASTGDAAPLACEPGEVYSCTLSDGCAGSQVCSGDGRPGPCDCGPPARCDLDGDGHAARTCGGADCDDLDPLSWDEGLHPEGCMLAGACLDSEAAEGTSDGAGYGACPAGLDCNGGDSTCTMSGTETEINCRGVGCTEGYCIDFGPGPRCWLADPCCVNDPDGFSCSELFNRDGDGCLQLCERGSVQCARECIESSQELAQVLLGPLHTCLAEAGCFAEEDLLGCANTHCLTLLLICSTS